MSTLYLISAAADELPYDYDTNPDALLPSDAALPNLVATVERLSGIRLPNDTLSAIRTIGELATAVATQLRRVPSGIHRTKLVTQFESLGDNCELGLLQREFGAEPLGLLRWSSGSIENVTRGIECGFEGIAEGLKALGDLRWGILSPRYEMQWHTWIAKDQMTEEQILRQQAKVATFLSRKLMEDITAADKTFVVKSRRTPLTLEKVLPLFAALRRHGSAAVLLWLTEGETNVEEVKPGLLHGRITQFGEQANLGGTTHRREWLQVLQEVAV